MARGAKLGQHFLKDAWAARAVARATLASPDEPILEIGPGKGILTKELLLISKKVIAVEKDDELIPLLQEKFADELASGALTLIHTDIRDFKPQDADLEAGKYILAANIPYYITGEIIRQFLTTALYPRAMSLLVQKEVAMRSVDKKESILSLSIKAYGTPRVAAKVPRRHFSPPPSIDSAVLCIENISKDFFKNFSEESFFAVVKAGFAAKRKMLANNLGEAFGKEKAIAAMEKAGIQPKSRAEDVHLASWKMLTKHLTD